MNALLCRIGLTRPELRAWALYDWANSVFMTTVLMVFPIYFTKVAAAGLPPAVASARFAIATTFALTLMALLSPFLGALADAGAMKKRCLAIALGVGVVNTGALASIGRGEWKMGLAFFVLGNIGVTASQAFYDSLLPHVARPEEIHRVSSAGYAMGYLGGGLLLLLNLFWIQKPELWGFASGESATRWSFLSAAIWWLLFSIPLFRTVSEPPALSSARDSRESLARQAWGRLGQTLTELRAHRDAFVMLLAFLLYNDGIQTIIRMATLYGTEVGIPSSSLIGAVVLVQFVGIPCTYFFGLLASRIGAKSALYIALVVYVILTIIGYYMLTAAQFYLLAVLVGTVMGGNQAISRSLFASMIPRHKSAEFFGFFGVFEKFAGVLGPALFAIVVSRTGSSRNAILGLIVFFIVGAVLLSFVNVARGQQVARAEEGNAV